MSLILLVVPVLIFGGGGGYFAYRRHGDAGLGGVFGTVLLVLLIVWLAGGRAFGQTVSPVVVTTPDVVWTPILNALIALIALVMTTLIGIYVPKGIAAFTARTGIILTAQQQQTVKDSANTAKGIVQTMLDQGALKLEHVTPDNPVIVAQARAAIDRVPNAAAAMNKSVPSMAETIVGLVDTSPKTPTVVVAAVPVSPMAPSIPRP